MCHTHLDVAQSEIGGVRNYVSAQIQSWKMIARPPFKKIGLSSIALAAVTVSAVLGSTAHASTRTVILNYVCSSYESARQVALAQSWRSRESMPDDCRTLFQQPFELRVAEIHQVMEAIPIEDGRWTEIGRVRSSMESGYSAGIADPLLLF